MKRYLIPLFLFLPALGMGLAASPAQAAPSCADLAETAGAQVGAPEGVMAAISLVETGTGGQAWPWTLNEGGKGMHFDTRDEALAYLRAAVDRGVTNIDVGCMQLNFRWHASGFVSLEDMIDPALNTRYAALFLNALHKRLGNWEDAVANYHSADATRGARYKDKVAQAMGAPVAPTSDLAPTLDVAEAGTEAADPGVTSGILVSGAQPLVPVSSQGGVAEERIEMASMQLALPRMQGTPMILRQREDLPARLGNRWAAVQAARAQLSVSN